MTSSLIAQNVRFSVPAVAIYCYTTRTTARNVSLF